MTTIEFWNLIVSSSATILAGIAILLYIIMWYKDKSNNSYDIFDATYLDILKTGMENPSFRNPILTNDYINSFSENEKIKYEIYAFISWNFCETIFDKGDVELMKTWSVVIDTENNGLIILKTQISLKNLSDCIYILFYLSIFKNQAHNIV